MRLKDGAVGRAGERKPLRNVAFVMWSRAACFQFLASGLSGGHGDINVIWISEVAHELSKFGFIFGSRLTRSHHPRTVRDRPRVSCGPGTPAAVSLDKSLVVGPAFWCGVAELGGAGSTTR